MGGSQRAAAGALAAAGADGVEGAEGRDVGAVALTRDRDRIHDSASGASYRQTFGG